MTAEGGDRLLVNKGDGTFADGTSSWGITNAASSRGIVAFDYDNDGWIDIFVSNNGSQNVLYHNRGDGAFEDATTSGGVAGVTDNAGMGVATGDIDNDGDLDLWQVDGSNQPPNLFRNNLICPADNSQYVPGRNWLKLTLQGTVSNHTGIGARVELWQDGSLWQARQVFGGPGWRSQNDLTVSFGLGPHDYVEEVRVYWPSGVVTRVVCRGGRPTAGGGRSPGASGDRPHTQ